MVGLLEQADRVESPPHKLVQQHVLVVTVEMDLLEQLRECPLQQMVWTDSRRRLQGPTHFLLVVAVVECHLIPPEVLRLPMLMEVLAERAVAVEAQPNVPKIPQLRGTTTRVSATAP